MKWVVLALAVTSAVTGILAACMWFKASKVDFQPLDENGQRLPDDDVQAWLGAVRRTLDKSGKLNKSAASWTAVSVACAGLSVLAGAFAR